MTPTIYCDRYNAFLRAHGLQENTPKPSQPFIHTHGWIVNHMNEYILECHGIDIQQAVQPIFMRRMIMAGHGEDAKFDAWLDMRYPKIITQPSPGDIHG